MNSMIITNQEAIIDTQTLKGKEHKQNTHKKII